MSNDAAIPVTSGPTVLVDELDEALKRLKGLVRRDEEVDAEMAARTNERILAIMERADLPQRAWRFVREYRGGGHQAWESMRDAIRAKLASPETRVIGIVGFQGTGKTCLAVDALRDEAKKLRPVRFVDAVDFEGAMLDARQKGEIMATLREYQEPAVLVIDQFDKASSAAWESRFMFRLVDSRYARDACRTIFVANVAPPAQRPLGPDGLEQHMSMEFKKMLGSSIAGRTMETGEIFCCVWDTFRKPK